MILIADSGSTKTDWAVLRDNGETDTYNTKGINPFMMTMDEIRELLERELSFRENKPDAIYYYGAGALPGKKEQLAGLLQDYFSTEKVEVHSDLLAAARSLCQDKEGIACILGTGSNSCYYNGKDIVENVSPLGYILGDEGSGAVLGRHLVADVLKKQLPEHICQQFFETYRVTAGEIIEHVYRKPFANRYLAQYTRFLGEHIAQPEIEDFVERHFTAFFVRNIMQYEQVRNYPVCFTGSIAFVFRNILARLCDGFGLKLGTISPAPMEGLIKYHQTN